MPTMLKLIFFGGRPHLQKCCNTTLKPYRYAMILSPIRHQSTDAATDARLHTRKAKHKMKAWHIYDYGGNEELSFSDTVRIPAITRPTDMLVEVKAASVNPIDVAMRGGYGKTMINMLRKQFDPKKGSELPLTLGRDFSGVVIETGKSVRKFKPGDEVWGALAASRQGTHSQYTVVGEREISHKPKSISHIEAGSMPYVATTVWAALCISGELSAKNTRSKRVLIHGGSGGIGTFAVQLMNAWGADVTATCSTDAVDMVLSLGADCVIDYKTTDVSAELKKLGRFDLILDPIGEQVSNFSMDLLRTWNNAKYVSLVPPLLPHTDKLGVVGGLASASASLGFDVMKGFSQGRSYRWAFFIPNGYALETVAALVDRRKIKAVIDEVMPMERIPDAFTKVGQKHGRGKTVIEMSETSD